LLHPNITMKISLVIEDAGSGPQVIFSSPEPADARQFFKTHANPGKLVLVCNPTPDNFRTIRGTPVVEAVAVKAPIRRVKEPLL
jgi:hypothetical protein